ncbi:hypothetical protein DER46DRAFT_681159 [Fusarium sp. MPI-SDFR-AT-0072]|nr:hypothetical protein DER46DRAFT_681159 [Fusarium sp. MPI-SDFR-AT-0072]
MENRQRQLGRVGSRLSDILVLPLEAVEIAGKCRDQLTGQLRDWLCFPPLSYLFQVRFSAEQFVKDVCGTLRLERARTSVTLVEKKETNEEAQTRRMRVYESLVPKPWGFLTGQEEKGVGGIPVMKVELQVNEVFIERGGGQNEFVITSYVGTGFPI